LVTKDVRGLKRRRLLERTRLLLACGASLYPSKLSQRIRQEHFSDCVQMGDMLRDKEHEVQNREASDSLKEAVFRGQHEVVELICTKCHDVDSTQYLLDVVAECAFHQPKHLSWNEIRRMIDTLLRSGTSINSRRKTKYIRRAQLLRLKGPEQVRERVSAIELASRMHLRDDIERKELLALLKSEDLMQLK